MLVLSRKQGESIRIDSEIEIEVLDVQRGRIRLGVRAPQHRRITRLEIAEQRPAEQRHTVAAAQEPTAQHSTTCRPGISTLGRANQCR